MRWPAEETPCLLSLSATVTVVLITLNRLLEGRRRGQRRKLPDCLMLLVRTHQRGEGRWSRDGFQFPIFPILPLNRFHWGPWTTFLMLCTEHGHLTINSVHIPESETACLGSSPASAPERWISYLTSQFLHLWNGNNNNRTHTMKVLWELNEINHVMNFSQSLAWHVGNS